MQTKSQPLTEDQKRTYEKAWLEPYVKDIVHWNDLRYQTRQPSKLTHEFVVWHLDNNLPRVLQVYKVTGFNIGVAGPVMLLSARTGRGIQVTHVPTEIPEEGVFLWIPAFADVNYTPARYDMPPTTNARRLNWRMCVRSKSSPRVELDKDATYFSAAGDFLRLWPNSTF